MICPDCGGSGRIRKRFLIFFTRRARCGKCLGTGTYPPAIRPQVRFNRTRGARQWDDDPWPSPTLGSSSTSSRPESDSFDVGSGGRSGGGGATASWDAPGEAPPVIAEPFSSDSSSAVNGAISAEATDPGPDASSSSSESSGGGTS